MPTRQRRAQRAGVALFVVVAFVTLAWRNEVQDDKVNRLIEQKAADDYASCLARKANVERLNTLYAGLVRIEQSNPFRFTSPKTIEDRVRLFTEAQLVPPDCGRKP